MLKSAIVTKNLAMLETALYRAQVLYPVEAWSR